MNLDIGRKLNCYDVESVVNNAPDNSHIPELIEMISYWHHDRNLVKGATHQSQFVKLMEEVGELAGNISKSRSFKDDIGDIIVVLINMCERENITLGECINHAWNDIKDRKGKMINGSFVKESDLEGYNSELVESYTEEHF